MAVVDAFETMTAARSYRVAVTAVAARAELTRCAGTHFDPAMVRAFLAIALPRLLWSVGPLAFCLNVPFLRWIGDGGVHFAQAASTTAVTAANAVGVTAAVVATGALPAGRDVEEVGSVIDGDGDGASGEVSTPAGSPTSTPTGRPTSQPTPSGTGHGHATPATTTAKPTTGGTAAPGPTRRSSRPGPTPPTSHSSHHR